MVSMGQFWVKSHLGLGIFPSFTLSLYHCIYCFILKYLKFLPTDFLGSTNPRRRPCCLPVRTVAQSQKRPNASCASDDLYNRRNDRAEFTFVLLLAEKKNENITLTLSNNAVLEVEY